MAHSAVDMYTRQAKRPMSYCECCICLLSHTGSSKYIFVGLQVWEPDELFAKEVAGGC